MDTTLPHIIHLRLLGRHSRDIIHVQGICPSVEASRLRRR